MTINDYYGPFQGSPSDFERPRISWPWRTMPIGSHIIVTDSSLFNTARVSLTKYKARNGGVWKTYVNEEGFLIIQRERQPSGRSDKR